MSADKSAMVRFERHLGRLLIAGVIVSAIALACGLIFYYFAPDNLFASRLLTVGLVLLMATPMLRVVVSIVEYVRMREWFFVVTTLAVLVELAVTVIYALRRQ